MLHRPRRKEALAAIGYCRRPGPLRKLSVSRALSELAPLAESLGGNSAASEARTFSEQDKMRDPGLELSFSGDFEA